MNSAAELETVLAALLSADNGTRNQAEAAIRGYVRTPASIEPMMVMVGTSVHASVRQMAAVFLRKRLCSHWAQLPPTAHPTIKAQLLTLLAGETYRPVRRAIAAVVAVLAKMLLKVEDSDVSQAPDGRIIISGATVMATWPELLQYLGQASAAPDASHRETAMLLFFYLGETCALRLRDHFETLIRIFDATLRDAESIAVRVMSLKAVGRLIEYLADEEHQVLQFRPLFPAMLQVLSQCVAADDLQTTILMLDVFSSLVDAPAPFVDPTIPELIMIVTTIQGLPAATKPLRDASLLILNSLARSKPKALVRNGKIAEIVRLVLMSLALPWDASEEEDPEYDDAQRDGVAGPPTHRIAQSVFDRIAIHLPSVQVIEAMVPICSEAMRAAEPHVRAMAPLALGIAAEGCEAILSKHVGEMLPSVVNLFRDADNGVRHCACFCVGQWIEHMEDVLTKHHAAIIPQAFMLLDAVSPPNAPVPDVQRGALYVLECFSERLPAEILAPYLDHLMTTIVGLLANTDGAVSAAIKSMALCVASTAAINAEQLFLPYFQRMAPGIKSLMSISDPTQFLLRAKAMQAMGQMAVAVGSDNFVADHLAETMHRAQEGLQFQDVVLDENTFIYFANMAQVRDVVVRHALVFPKHASFSFFSHTPLTTHCPLLLSSLYAGHWRGVWAASRIARSRAARCCVLRGRAADAAARWAGARRARIWRCGRRRRSGRSRRQPHAAQRPRSRARQESRRYTLRRRDGQVLQRVVRLLPSAVRDGVRGADAVPTRGDAPRGHGVACDVQRVLQHVLPAGFAVGEGPWCDAARTAPTGSAPNCGEARHGGGALGDARSVEESSRGGVRADAARVRDVGAAGAGAAD